VLRAIEQRLERIFEGVFGRAFRTNVQPVELARKLAKEMDENRSTSVTRIYVPNEYTIYLSGSDRKQFESYESSLVSELEEYLSEHAARENYALLTPPRVGFETDDDLGVGEFGIATRMAQHEGSGPADDSAEPIEEVASGATMIYKPRTPSSRGPDAAASSTRTAPCSAARGRSTSRSRIRTSRAATSKSCSRDPRGGSSTSARRTASR